MSREGQRTPEGGQNAPLGAMPGARYPGVYYTEKPVTVPPAADRYPSISQLVAQAAPPAPPAVPTVRQFVNSGPQINAQAPGVGPDVPGPATRLNERAAPPKPVERNTVATIQGLLENPQDGTAARQGKQVRVRRPAQRPPAEQGTGNSAGNQGKVYVGSRGNDGGHDADAGNAADRGNEQMLVCGADLVLNPRTGQLMLAPRTGNKAGDAQMATLLWKLLVGSNSADLGGGVRSALKSSVPGDKLRQLAEALGNASSAGNSEPVVHHVSAPVTRHVNVARRQTAIDLPVVAPSQVADILNQPVTGLVQGSVPVQGQISESIRELLRRPESVDGHAENPSRLPVPVIEGDNATQKVRQASFSQNEMPKQRKKPSKPKAEKVKFQSPRQMHNHKYLPYMEIYGFPSDSKHRETYRVQHFGSYQDREKLETTDLTGHIMSLFTAITSVQQDSTADQVLEEFDQDPCLALAMGMPEDVQAEPPVRHEPLIKNPEEFFVTPPRVAVREVSNSHYLLKQMESDQDIIVKNAIEESSCRLERQRHAELLRKGNLPNSTFASVARKLWPNTDVQSGTTHNKGKHGKHVKEVNDPRFFLATNDRFCRTTEEHLRDQYNYLCEYLNIRADKGSVPHITSE